MEAKQLRVGMVIHFNKFLYRVMKTQIIAPGNWRAFVQTKLRKLADGTQTEYRFRSDEMVERAILDQRDMQFLYQEGDAYHFMDNKTYDQIQLTADDLGDGVNYLVPNNSLKIDMYEEKPVGIEFPKTVQLKVIETEPNIKSATATNTYKPAKVENGATFQVPGFIVTDDVITIDTTSGEYLNRA